MRFDSGGDIRETRERQHRPVTAAVSAVQELKGVQVGKHFPEVNAPRLTPVPLPCGRLVESDWGRSVCVKGWWVTSNIISVGCHLGLRAGAVGEASRGGEGGNGKGGPPLTVI